jgi:sugar/nucleoside kinase (ribokinase family)
MHSTSISKPEILGIGNALVDIMIVLPDDSFLSQYKLPRGSMTLVDEVQSASIYSATRLFQKNITTGGSAANTIHALSSLGCSCGYAGKIGADELGQVFATEFHEKNIRTHLPHGNSDTGRVMALVSPDSERTMATFLGAAGELLPEDFSPELMSNYSIAYVEGYLVQNHSLMETILRLAKESGLRVAIDLSSYNIVTLNLGFLKEMVKRYVDIVFANEEEAFAFTGLDPLQSVREMAQMCELVVVKQGKQGSLVSFRNEITVIPPVITEAVDTTGAGDIYAAGFLYGLTRELNISLCGRIASLLSSKIVETLGAKMPDREWPGLLHKIREFEASEV